MEDRLEGGCACGAVRYRLESAPMFVHCCHCRDCQRQTGSAFVINALIETARVTVLQGEVLRSSMPTESGRPHGIDRCKVCGTAVWSEYGGLAKPPLLGGGTLHDPTPGNPPRAHHVPSKVPPVAPPPGVPSFGGFYQF